MPKKYTLINTQTISCVQHSNILSLQQKMNLNHQIFSGIFGDEIGQRYLTMFGHVTENAYSDLCETCGPTQQRRLKECLLKVPGWDKSVITSEIENNEKLS